jgi:phage shock protein PspC (stress-responsive transcriptional regulator)
MGFIQFTVYLLCNLVFIALIAYLAYAFILSNRKNRKEDGKSVR